MVGDFFSTFKETNCFEIWDTTILLYEAHKVKWDFVIGPEQ